MPIERAISGVDRTGGRARLLTGRMTHGVGLDVRDESGGERFGLSFDPGLVAMPGQEPCDRSGDELGASAASPSSWFVGCGSCSSTMCASS